MPFSDALDRETAWLRIIDDTEPVLLADGGGPFQIIQARWPRVLASNKTGLYVLRSTYVFKRFASQQSMSTTALRLRLVWPLKLGTGSAETAQLDFEQAIDQVITRVAGPLGDKSHGGRFGQVAESGGVAVEYQDPELSISNGAFRADITYSADDTEITN